MTGQQGGAWLGKPWSICPSVCMEEGDGQELVGLLQEHRGSQGTGTGGGSHSETKAGGARRTKEPSAGSFPGEEGLDHTGHLGKTPSHWAAGESV